MDWPLVFLRSFVVVSLGGCPTIGRADLAHTDGASDINFLGKLKPLTKLDQKFASLGGVLTIGLADLAHMDGASDFIFPETYPATTS